MGPWRSLRSRLVASYLLVVALGLAAAAVALLFLLQGYRDRLVLTRLADVAGPVAVLVRQGESAESVAALLREQTEDAQVRVLLLDRLGRVVQDSAEGEPLRGQRLTAALPPLAEPRQAVAGRYEPAGERALLFVLVRVASLLPRVEAAGVAYVVVAQPEEVVPLLAQLFPRLLAAGAVAVLAAVLIGLLVARSLYRPIRRLTVASERMSRGDYDQRVAEEGPEELAELARSFNHMAAETQRSRQVLRDFVANVSHELKTPLTAIRGFVQALGDGTVSSAEERARALAVVDVEARRLQGLVAELLDLSRLEAGQVELARRPVRLSELVAHCREIFALRAEEQGVGLVPELVADPVVAGDADRLEQLLNNLLDNALKHAPRGGEVRLAVGVPAPGLATLAVSDNGPGIAAGELPHVFQRFYTSRGSAGGTGLGLAIAREIARAHGGDLGATSLPHQATTFTATLPLWQEQSTAPAPSVSRQPV
ncbi:MAG: sensor histidine kinase [Chloroflexota bacterium]